MKIKYFDDGFIGKSVYDINEAVKCFNAGMDVRFPNGCDFLWEDEEGNDPDEGEIIDRIIDGIKTHGEVYVGFQLEGQKVVDINSTNLSCDIHVGQTVYALFSGEIVSGEVKCISLATGKIIENNSLLYYNDALIYGACDEHTRYDKFKEAMGWLRAVLAKDCVCIKVKDINKCLYYPSDEVFATKEALVKDLLRNAK